MYTTVTIALKEDTETQSQANELSVRLASEIPSASKNKWNRVGLHMSGPIANTYG